MSDYRSDNPSSSGGDDPTWPNPAPGADQGGRGSSRPEPSPFSREGADGSETPGTGDGANGSSAGGSYSDPSPQPPSDQPTAPAAWPGYPASAPEGTHTPGRGPEQPYGAPSASPYETPGAGPYGQPRADPVQAPPPGFDAQPTGQYGTGPNDQGYGPPLAAYGQAQAYGANPYEPAPNPYQPSYGGYSPYGVAPVQHPKATPALIFGILGLVFSLSCGIGGLLGIGGIVNGRRARGEIDADPQRYLGRGMASAGFGLGLAGTIIGSLVTIIFIIAGASGAFNS